MPTNGMPPQSSSGSISNIAQSVVPSIIDLLMSYSMPYHQGAYIFESPYPQGGYNTESPSTLNAEIAALADHGARPAEAKGSVAEIGAEGFAAEIAARLAAERLAAEAERVAEDAEAARAANTGYVIESPVLQKRGAPSAPAAPACNVRYQINFNNGV